MKGDKKMDFLNVKKSPYSEFVGYAIVGLIATIVDVGSLYVVTEFMGIYYLLSNVIAFSLGLITNYSLCTRFVFKSRKLENTFAEFGVFTLIGVIGLGLNTLLLWSLTQFVGVYYMISKVIAVIIVFVFNFWLRKKILF